MARLEELDFSFYDVFEKRVKEYVTSNLFLAGYRLVVNHAAAPLRIIHDLFWEHPSSPSLRLAKSPSLHDLVRWCVAPDTPLRYRVAIRTISMSLNSASPPSIPKQTRQSQSEALPFWAFIPSSVYPC